MGQFLVAHQSSDVILRMHETCTKQRVRPQICSTFKDLTFREEAATTKHIYDSNAQKYMKSQCRSSIFGNHNSGVLLSCFYFGNSICGCLLSRKGLVAPRYSKGFDTVPRGVGHRVLQGFRGLVTLPTVWSCV
jgi:hypothetical protein